MKKAINFAIDRPELVRVFGYLANRRTDQMLPPELGRDERIYPLGGSDPATARKWYARARLKPRTLVFYTGNNQRGVAVAQTLEFNLKQIGIDLDPKYYDFGELFQKVGTRGEPFDIAFVGWIADWADPANYFEPLLDPDLRDDRQLELHPLHEPAGDRQGRRGGSLERHRPPHGVGRPGRRSDAHRPSLGADLPPDDPYIRLAELRLLRPQRFYGIDLAAACKK